MKKNALILLLMMVIIPIAGELKFYPFGGSFRISFAVPIFFLLLMWLRQIPLTIAGFGVGASIVCFRLALGHFYDPYFVFHEALLLQIPALFYYLTYAWLFDLTEMSAMRFSPIKMGVYCILIEFTASLVELAYRALSLNENLSLFMLAEVMLIAIIRSFFSLSFFFIVKLREAEVLAHEKTAQNEQMLLLISTLYQESTHLKKTLHHAENITAECYRIYRALKETPKEELNQADLAKSMLIISGQVHDIKKDNQKIVAGLSKLIQNEPPMDYMDFESLGQLVIGTNEKYAESLGKHIHFTLEADSTRLSHLPRLPIFTLLSLMNNLLVNAVEAIAETGRITLWLDSDETHLSIKVQDTGIGISPRQQTLIFEPGYTSKYDSRGNPSTGIGLTYVKEMVEQLCGDISLSSSRIEGDTEFTLRLPLAQISKNYSHSQEEIDHESKPLLYR